MRRWTARSVGLPVALSLMVAALAMGSVTSSVAADPAVHLPRGMQGETALRGVGERLDDVAAANGVTADVVADLLRDDPTAWLDRRGGLFFKDPPAEDAPEGAEAGGDEAVATAALADTFFLHSLPGAQQTIFLDFDGATATATGWHATYPALPGVQPAWDPAGDGPSFSDAELLRIQAVWQVVAEDYAPFGIDVTTADPGPAAINRSSSSDLRFGSHVLVTPSTATQAEICPNGCGGVAYINVFDAVLGAGGDGYGYRQPAWVFPHMLANSAKNVGEAASHEAGHNLGLSHDANAGAGYDSGHGAWAPIMGSGYGRPITQWSQGSYAGATNQEDDVAKIGAIAGLRPDEAPGSVGGAVPLTTGTAYVNSRTDVDTYALGSCVGTVTVDASTLGSFADLDLRLALRDADGDEVAVADPASATIDASSASGTGASISYAAAPGSYYVSVDGVGNGPWSTGYDDYGSLGSYRLAVTGCAVAKSTLTGLTASVSARSAVLVASVSAASGSPTGTVEFRDDGALVGTAAISGGSATVTVGDLTRGLHPFRATFVPAAPADFASSLSGFSTVSIAATTTTTSLQAGSSGQAVTLTADVSASQGRPRGVVSFFDGSVLVGAVGVVSGVASLALSGVSPGQHLYTARFEPDDGSRWDGSTSTERVMAIAAPPTLPTSTFPTPNPTSTAGPSTAPPPPTPTTSTSRTPSVIRIEAPRWAERGSRPVVRIRVVSGTTSATGKILVRIGAKRTVLVLRAGQASITLPSLRRKVRIAVLYIGSTTAAQATAARTVKVRR